MTWYESPSGQTTDLPTTPRPASWNRSSHPDQLRLRRYLEKVTEITANAVPTDLPWGVRLDVGLDSGKDLLRAADMDNYLLPVARVLGNANLVSVWGTKGPRPTSAVTIAPAVEAPVPTTTVWSGTTTTSAETVAFKVEVRKLVVNAVQLPPGPVSLQVAFTVGPRRNWLNLWKSTIDALDPILGRTEARRPWHPQDGRIIELGLHRAAEPGLGHHVRLDITAHSLVQPSAHGPLWDQLARQPRALASDLRLADIPTSSGVYAWFRDGEPVYAGRARASLRTRMSAHLDRSLDLSRSSLRRNVADHVLGIPTSVSRRRPTIVTQQQVDQVNAWIAALYVAWVELGDGEAASDRERRLLTEWKPPLNRA